MTREEQLKFCRNCKNQKFDAGQGIICGLTGKIADFAISCDSYIEDPERKIKNELTSKNMEEMDRQFTDNEQSGSNLTISETATAYLAETGKWTKFLSIMGFVFIGIIVILGLFAGSIFSLLPGGEMNNINHGIGILFGVIYVLMGLLYLFPTLYLFNFSQKLKSAISRKSNEDLDKALSNQKSFYKFFGIMAIVGIGLYVVIGLIALTGAIFN